MKPYKYSLLKNALVDVDIETRAFIKGKNFLLIFFFNFSTYRVGTCYTSSECASKSGKAAGNCAAG